MANTYCAHTQMVDIEKVIPNPRNPNKHPDKQIALLAKIISAQGWRAPITVSNRSGFIVRGHGRLMAAQKLGLAQVPVDYQDYETEAAEWADMIADNRLGELSENDGDLMAGLLQDLTGLETDIELTGFTAADVNSMLLGPPGETFERDPGSGYKEQYGVIAVCESEREQASAYDAIKALGYNCRVVTT